jgi:hypothetical protein
MCRDDIALETFHKSKDAQDAKLTLYEVAALRLYTSSSFRRINNPLRYGSVTLIASEPFARRLGLGMTLRMTVYLVHL